ncbi:PEP-utilizing enzyme [Rhodococcus cercidiphylli]|uniref:PEP-utilizing enzyme n=1 Tax=Rhodococcus cercidiphylli TaxID=489916 RepID=A0ABU4AWI0_9NOCA|nr:PEP-utilizing enzyme [Rhodococcus cercidiphylli]MDV6230595.1 PEP-utilizing enzyme [Rhodococcus cercidiphylli]
MTTQDSLVDDDSARFEVVGRGLTVYESTEPIVGRAKWLDSPDDVISFVESGEDVSDVIVIARGGTTTFLAMALNAGVRGVLTLQGAPESHLGILSREYGIPCIMSVAFDRGVRTARAETVPADGVLLSMNVSSRPEGVVSVEHGAPVDDSPVEDTGGPAMSAEQMAQIQALLANFQAEVPHGSEGDAIMQTRLTTNVLDLDDPAHDHDLSTEEVNDILRYLAWNEWDALAARATEGESGLIPRQEYEAMGILDSWFQHPRWLELIEQRVGRDGVEQIGARARTEVGTKINLLHNWACAAAASFGRGIALEVGLHDYDYKAGLVTDAMSSARRLYKGLWGSGPMFSSMRNYRAPVLDPSWVERFETDRMPLDDASARSTFQRFNGALELLGFLVHFDNRLGLGDSGPYPTADGGFVIVRDLFVNEPAYEWSATTAGLPYAVTIAMFFAPEGGLETKVVDLSTLFTEPANYLPFVTGVAVYAREKFDTPMEELRTLSLSDMTSLRDQAESASEALYKYIASMTQEEKILAGAVVYASGFLMPFARAAGMFDELVADHGMMSLDPVTRECYDTIISGVATELIPRLFLTGSWANEVPPHSGDTVVTADNEFEILHAIRVRGFASADQIASTTGLRPEDITPVLDAADAAGHVKQRTGRIVGARLTPTGRARHLLIGRTQVSDDQRQALTSSYDAFLVPNRAFKTLTTRWQTEKQLDATTTELTTIHATATSVLADASRVDARFGRYEPRLTSAFDRFRNGDTDALAKPLSESYHDVWMELHEDMLVTLGRERTNDDE